MTEHVTQLAPTMTFLALTPDDWRELMPTEDFTLRVSRVGVRLPEDDLFAGAALTGLRPLLRAKRSAPAESDRRLLVVRRPSAAREVSTAAGPRALAHLVDHALAVLGRVEQVGLGLDHQRRVQPGLDQPVTLEGQLEDQPCSCVSVCQVWSKARSCPASRRPGGHRSPRSRRPSASGRR
jgi:hypothetical protein